MPSAASLSTLRRDRRRRRQSDNRRDHDKYEQKGPQRSGHPRPFERAQGRVRQRLSMTANDRGQDDLTRHVGAVNIGRQKGRREGVLRRTAGAYPPIILRGASSLAADLNPASRLDRGLFKLGQVKKSAIGWSLATARLIDLTRPSPVGTVHPTTGSQPAATQPVPPATSSLLPRSPHSISIYTATRVQFANGDDSASDARPHRLPHPPSQRPPTANKSQNQKEQYRADSRR